MLSTLHSLIDMIRIFDVKNTYQFSSSTGDLHNLLDFMSILPWGFNVGGWDDIIALFNRWDSVMI